MSEIDDIYKEGSEELDMEFLEKLKKGSKNSVVIGDYLEGAKRLRKDYAKQYKKYLVKKRWRAWHTKKKKEKVVRFKRLKVKHFDFERGVFDRFRRGWGLLFFKLKRFVWFVWNKYIPKWLLYGYYKIKKFVFVWSSDFRDSNERLYSRFKDFAGKVFDDIWKMTKDAYIKISHMLYFVVGKILFWRKVDTKTKKKEYDKKEEGLDESS